MSETAIRAAVPGDAREIARIHVASWQATYRGMLPDEMLDELTVEGRETAWRERLTTSDEGGFVLLAETDGTAAGFLAATTPLALPEAEVAALYVHPDHVRHGHGGALLTATLGRFAEAGYAEASLWVLSLNSAGRAFYEREGWAADGATRSDRSAGIPEYRYRIRVRSAC